MSGVGSNISQSGCTRFCVLFKSFPIVASKMSEKANVRFTAHKDAFLKTSQILLRTSELEFPRKEMSMHGLFTSSKRCGLHRQV